jgi:flagellar secretion chaperone FliS
MSTAPSSATRSYAQIGLRAEIESASPHRLIQLMMERVLTKIALARGHMERAAVAEKGMHVSDAIGIIEGLQGSLNHKADERLAGNFDALYDYMKRRLLEANLHNDPAGLDEVSTLMRELKEAWDAIADQAAEQAGPAADAERR